VKLFALRQTGREAVSKPQTINCHDAFVQKRINVPQRLFELLCL